MHPNNPGTGASASTPAAREVTPTPQLLLNAGIVFAGGTAGALLRALLTALPQSSTADLLTLFAINTLGAFALALITARTIPTRWQLALGTGLCGGFTTYSTMAVSAATGLSAQNGAALLAALATVIIGLGASALGWRLRTAPTRGGNQ